jgi:hypothetical protein
MPLLLFIYSLTETFLHTRTFTYHLFITLVEIPWIFPHCNRSVNRARIFKRLWSPGIDSKERIPPAYVAWRAGTITLFLLGS